MRFPRLPAATWTLADQAVLSLGTFLFNIVLARHIPISSYGGYAMFIGIMSLIQVLCGTLLFYPLSVRGAVLDEIGRRRLIATSLMLTAVLGLPTAVLLAALADAFIQPGLFWFAVFALAASQIQEALRRGLLSSFRHRDAILGDAASYLGQVALILIVARHSDLDLETALFIMALTSLLGAGIQFLQVRPAGSSPRQLVPTFRDFWSLGIWSLSSNLLSILRGQSLPWLLTLASGPAAAGLFQAAVNIANVTNPIQTGVANVVPQVAARAHAKGEHEALVASWPFIAVGLPIIGAMAIVMMFIPGDLLALAYRSRFQDEAILTPIKLMAVSCVFNYVAAAGCAYLHGVNGGRAALVADVAFTVAVMLTVYPAIIYFGIAGACATTLLGMTVRAAFIIVSVARRVSPERARPMRAVSPTIRAAVPR